MRTLLDEQYAPITSSFGFIDAALERVTDALVTWRTSLRRPEQVQVERLQESFPGVLHRLEPLTAGATPRELLVATRSSWTAYFDCGLRGG